MVVHLNEAGLIDWTEWAETLSAELHAADAAADGSDYYARWLKALEKLLTAKDIVSGSYVESLAQAWQRAAHATPHGNPILLENDPQGAGKF